MPLVSDSDGYASLVEALAAIAAEPTEQARLLSLLTRVASELRRGAAVELLDVEQLARDGVVPGETGFLITRIEEVLDELVADPAGIAFTEHALRNDPRWKLARTLAREALEQLGERAPRSRILPA
jgi:hypothetical protein